MYCRHWHVLTPLEQVSVYNWRVNQHAVLAGLHGRCLLNSRERAEPSAMSACARCFPSTLTLLAALSSWSRPQTDKALIRSLLYVLLLPKGSLAQMLP